MTEAPPTITPVFPTAEQLQPVRDLFRRGLSLQAHAAALEIGPLVAWRGAQARIMAVQLAMQMGAPRLAGRHAILAFREHPDVPEAINNYLRRVFNTRGPLDAWRKMERLPLPDSASDEDVAHRLVFQVEVLGRLRDFDAAEACLIQAEHLTPRTPQVLNARAELLEQQDRREEALAVARECLVVQPWHRWAVLTVASLLGFFERDEEAIALLTEATTHVESGPMWARLAGILMEKERFTEAAKALDEYARQSPLMEKSYSDWLAGRRADCAYGLGDRKQALEWARQAPGLFWATVVGRMEKADLEQPPETRMLPVPFVGQHHQTCAPATLASISRYWSKPGEHLAMTEEITYDGTPAHRQRLWALQHGWSAREFSVTWDNARALVARGIPFALTTSSPGSAHLQAVVGYDELRGTLFIRDPSKTHIGEVLAEPFIEAHRSLGPRGLVIVPREKAELLAEVELLDAELHDHLHEMRIAFDDHDRPRAVRALDALRAQGTDHRLTLQGRRMLANYDGNPSELLDVLTSLSEMFPDEQTYLIGRVETLRDLSRRDERLVLVKKLCEGKSPDSISLQLYARELAPDAREFLLARRLLNRAIRRNAGHAEHYHQLAHLLWDRRRFEEAFVLYRFAACLEDKGEGYSRSFFRAARCINRTAEAVVYLRQRFDRFGRKSPLPSRTLARALADMGRNNEAHAVFDEAIRLRPEDGAVLLQAADLCLEDGLYARAEELITAAHHRTHSSVWLRNAARLASAQGKLDESRGLWEQLLAEDPLALDAHRSIVQLLAGSQGREVALAHLRAACERFPHHYELLKLWNEWLRDEDPVGAEEVIRRLLQSHPLSAWGHRELAMNLGRQGRCDEAMTALEEAARLEPQAVTLFSVKGFVLVRAGRFEEAKEAYRQAILLDVDSDVSIRGWIRLCNTLAERREVFAFIETELARQVTFGDGLFAFQQTANNTLQPAETLAILRRAFEARPDLWQAWSALTDQLTDMQLLDEALPHAQEATARFPLVAGLWVDLGRVLFLRQDTEGEIACLRRALEINPGWARPQRLLAECYERLGRFEESHAILDRSVRLAPLNAANRFSLADILWKLRRHEQALTELRHSLMLDPLPAAAWGRLCEWTKELGRPREAVEAAQKLCEARPTEPRLWVALGRTLAGVFDKADEAIAAFDRALALNPHLVEAHERKVDFLCSARRYDEAGVQCKLDVWGGKPPLSIRMRLAVILAELRDYPQAKSVIRDVLREDPNSYQGWAYLADWSESTRTWNEYLEAAENMVRLAPNRAAAYGYRAAGRRNTGDRAGAKVDYRKALHLAPDYTWAAFELFDTLLQDGDSREAFGVLRHLRRYRRNEFVHARACKLYAKHGSVGGTLRVLRRLALSTHSSSWPFETSVEACVNSRRFPTLQQTLISLLEHPKCRPQVAVEWGRGLEPGKSFEAARPHLDRALEMIDREIAADPKVFKPHDVKAELLAYAGRHAEAEAACAHPAQTQSPWMRGRLAWVCAEAGDLDRAVQTMREVLSKEADYDWGWRRLADWTEKQKDWPLHLEATENMVRLRPKAATSYGYRGEARFRTDDLAGAKEDFRQAGTLDPEYHYAFSRLFELCLDDDELEECDRCLVNLTRLRDDEYNWRRVGRLALKREEPAVEEALAALRKLALSPHSSAWPLGDLHDGFVNAGKRKELGAAYAELLPQENCRPQVATLWVDLTDYDDLATDPALAARVHELLDRAIAAAPTELRPYDFKAMLYGAEKRYDEAEAVCRLPAVAHLVAMRARLGWVQRKRGRYTQAITLWRGCVEENPNSSWSYMNMMEVAGDIDAWTMRQFAAEGYVRLNPKRPAGYRHRGHAKRDLGDKVGATEDIREARKYEPRNNGTAMHLFDVLLDQGRFDEAAAVLEEIRERVYVPYKLSGDSRLEARTGKVQESLEKLRQLCNEGKDDDDWVLTDVLKQIKDHVPNQAIEDVLFQALQGEKVLPGTGEQWLERRSARQEWLSPDEVHSWSERGRPGLSVLVGHALTAAKTCRADELGRTIVQYRDLLRKETWAWGRIGNALFRAGRFQEVIDWLSDWESRAGVTPTILFDLALSLRVLDRWDEAHRVQLHAQTLKGDTTTGMHELWLALDAALSGNIVEAGQSLDILAGGKLDADPPCVLLRDLIRFRIDGNGTSLDDLRLLISENATTKEGVNLQSPLEAAVRHLLAAAR